MNYFWRHIIFPAFLNICYSVLYCIYYKHWPFLVGFFFFILFTHITPLSMVLSHRCMKFCMKNLSSLCTQCQYLWQIFNEFLMVRKEIKRFPVKSCLYPLVFEEQRKTAFSLSAPGALWQWFTPIIFTHNSYWRQLLMVFFWLTVWHEKKEAKENSCECSSLHRGKTWAVFETFQEK